MNDDIVEDASNKDPLGLANRIIILSESAPDAVKLPKAILPREDFFEQRSAEYF